MITLTAIKPGDIIQYKPKPDMTDDIWIYEVVSINYDNHQIMLHYLFVPAERDWRERLLGRIDPHPFSFLQSCVKLSK